MVAFARVVVLSLVASSLLLPTVHAGTPQAPDLSDPAGDQAVPGPAGAQYDLHAAWVTMEDREMVVGLALGAIDEAAAHYQVGFGIAGPFRPDAVELQGVVRFVPSSQEAVFEAADLGGQVAARVPGVLSVSLAESRLEARFSRESIPFLDGAVLSAFTASAFPAAVGGARVTGAPTLDEGASDSVLPLPGRIGLGTVLVPARGPDLVGGADDSLPGPADLLGVWYEEDGPDVVLTYSLRSLDAPQLRDCERWTLWTYADVLHVYHSLDIAGAWVEHHYVTAEVEERTPGGTKTRELGTQLTLQFGSPGYAQLRLADAASAAHGFDSYNSVRAGCDSATASLEDRLEDNEFIPGPAGLASGAALLGLAALVRRRTR